MTVEEMKQIIRDNRRKQFSQSSQLSLGELIKKLEAIKDEKKDTEDEKTVVYDFENSFPTRLDSWRGSYDELALGFDLYGYNTKQDPKSKQPKLSKLIEHLKSAVDKEYGGWKGGDFMMDENTPLWVNNPGNYTTTMIIDVMDRGWEVVLITMDREYEFNSDDK